MRDRGRERERNGEKERERHDINNTVGKRTRKKNVWEARKDQLCFKQKEGQNIFRGKK